MRCSRNSDHCRDWALLLVGILLVRVGTAGEQVESTAPQVGVTSIVTTVADLERSVKFYVDVLDFVQVREPEPSDKVNAQSHAQGEAEAWLRLGDETIALRLSQHPTQSSYPRDSRSHDRWFQHLAIVVSDMDAAYRRLRAGRVTHISSGPQRLPEWNTAAAGIQAFYFRDPDGTPLELISYPPGKGQAKWQAGDERLFLGLDHTAIAVADTGAALAFYRDGLGFMVVGESENYGTEQEHLNGVFGSRVRITSLRGQFGPGIELLEYIAPADGRAVPADLNPLTPAFRETRVVIRRPTCAQLAGESQELRDPDGHAVRITWP